MKYQVEVWGITDPNKGLDALKHMVDFGVAIAWIETWNHAKYGERFHVGIIIPYTEELLTYRKLMRHMMLISAEHMSYGFMTYDMPISPLAPGDGGEIELKDCLFVPHNFSFKS
jgi:hypothetical protein